MRRHISHEVAAARSCGRQPADPNPDNPQSPEGATANVGASLRAAASRLANHFGLFPWAYAHGYRRPSLRDSRNVQQLHKLRSGLVQNVRHTSPTRQRGNAVWTRERKGASPRFGSISQDRRLAPCRSRRNGLTLLEVVLTLAIFVGAMAVLSQLVSTGHRATISSRLQTQAVIRAEAQMNEIVANPSLMVSAAGMPFENEYNPNAPGQWQWSLDVQSWTQNANLLQLELTVTHFSEDGIPNANYTLRRYVRDPQVLLESETPEEEALF